MIAKSGEESSFIQEAEKINLLELVLCYNLDEAKKITLENKQNLVKSTKIELFFAIIQEGKAIKTEEKLFSKTKNSLFNMLIGLGTSLDSISGSITHIYNNEFGKEKDGIHQRRSGINHIVLREIKKKNIELLCSITELNKLNEEEKAVVMGRIKQNIKQSKRAKVKYELVTLARTKTEMKNIVDVKALRRVLK